MLLGGLGLADGEKGDVVHLGRCTPGAELAAAYSFQVPPRVLPWEVRAFG